MTMKNFTPKLRDEDKIESRLARKANTKRFAREMRSERRHAQRQEDPGTWNSVFSKMISWEG